MLFTITTYTPTLIQALYSVSSLKTGRSDLASIKDSASVKKLVLDSNLELKI